MNFCRCIECRYKEGYLYESRASPGVIQNAQDDLKVRILRMFVDLVPNI